MTAGRVVSIGRRVGLPAKPAGVVLTMVLAVPSNATKPPKDHGKVTNNSGVVNIDIWVASKRSSNSGVL